MPYIARVTSTPSALPNDIDKLNFLIETDYGLLDMSEPVVGKLAKFGRILNWPFALVEVETSAPSSRRSRVIVPLRELASFVGAGLLEEGADIVALGRKARGADDLIVGRVAPYDPLSASTTPTITASAADVSIEIQSGGDQQTITTRRVSLNLGGGYLTISGEIEQSLEPMEVTLDTLPSENILSLVWGSLSLTYGG